MRVQGCFISDEEVQRVIDFIKKHSVSDYNDTVMEQINQNAADTGKPAKGSTEDHTGSGFEDELLPAAVEVILETGQASVSMLQRRLKQMCIRDRNRTLFRRSISWNTATSCSSNFWEPACG